MNTHSSPRTSGRLLRNFTCAPYAAGPFSASKFDSRCLDQKGADGHDAQQRVQLAQTKVYPWPARSG